MNRPRLPVSALATLAITGGYIVLTLIFTYPLVFQLDKAIIGLAGDAESHMWSYWWMRKALLELHTTPYFTGWLYYPEGVSLYFYAYNVVHAICSIPLQSLFSLIVTYNLTEMIGFVCAAGAACWLAYDVTGSRRASFLAGIAFGFAPIQVFHFNLGQPNLHGVEFMPIYILCLRRWLDNGAYRWMLGAALALCLTSFSDWQFAVYLELFTGIVLLAKLAAELELNRTERKGPGSRPDSMHRWRTVIWNLGWRTAAVQAIYALTVLPVVIPMLQELRSPDAYMYRGRQDTVYHAPDVLAFFIPNPEHPLWRDWAWMVFEDLKTPGIVLAIVSISYVAVVLAYFAVRHRWKQSRFWLISGLIFLVLALGPQLRIMGETTNIPLPYEVLFQFKIIQVSRAPARYFVVTALCLAILAAIGMQVVLTQYAQQKRQRWMYAVVVLALCFELLPAPVRAVPAAPTPTFMLNGTLDQAGALMEWPDAGNRSMYYATIHNHPVMYGEMSRDNPPGPILKYLRKGPFDKDIIAPEATWHCLADTYHITHLMVYHDEKYMRPLLAKERQQMLTEFVPSLTPLATDPDVSLYRLPAGDPQRTCVTMGDGWGKPREFGPDQPLYRWMAQTATIGLHRQVAGQVTLHFHAHSFAIPRQVQVYQEGVQVGEFRVNQLQPYEFTLDLPAGATRLEFRSVEPALSPADYGYDELEPVAVGLSQVWVENE